jgi:DNA-binding response OmpR family regulator
MARILVIDDDVQIREMLRQMLEREGYEVADAPDGKAAMKIQREDPAHLIITDIIMPEKEGLETIKEVRQEFPEVKIIAISGGGRIKPEPYLKIAEKFGARYIFTKPVEREELLAAVLELLTKVDQKA